MSSDSSRHPAAAPVASEEGEAAPPHAMQAARLKAVLDVAKALISERDLDSLLQRILREATRVVDADRGSLFLVDEETGELWAKIAQGIGAGREIRIPRGVGIAGHVAQTGESVLLVDAYADSRFNRTVDRETGYRTHGLLAVPMHDLRGQVVGVLQALNKSVGHFTREDAEILGALGGQAAAAIENALLHDEIHLLFKGFVKAAVVAIESRDPTTGGHSERVARLTLGLAEAVQRSGKGPWHGLEFTADHRMEIRYAALLHDFGKMGVREDVLVKALKLYPQQLDALRLRFDLARRSHEAACLRRQLDLVRAGAPPAAIEAVERELATRLGEIDQAMALVETCNRPTVLAGGTFDSLQAVRALTYPGPGQVPQPLVTQAEIAQLSIPKGTLSLEERRDIESHVSHTFRFLSQIPWTRSLRRVPHIAHGHHEKLDGSGYPLGLSGAEIGVEARMMAIADIYDALTASDRPYKRAVPHDAAVRILDAEVQRGQLDGDLLATFLDERVPEATLEPSRPVSVASPRVSGIF